MIIPESTTASATAVARQRAGARVPARDSRFARRLGEILAHATDVFCDKGYDAASMRDLSRATGMSLAGLYYYFESKEKLLYLIQKHAFSTILDRLRERLAGQRDPEQRIRIFILNHLDYFLANQKAMKVLTHEDEVLGDPYGEEVRAIKREYYRICVGLVEDFWKSAGDGRVARPRAAKPRSASASAQAAVKFSARPDGHSVRVAVLTLFGMMNWIYTWHNPRIDADAGALAGQMADIFLNGIRAGVPTRAAASHKR